MLVSPFDGAKILGCCADTAVWKSGVVMRKIRFFFFFIITAGLCSGFVALFTPRPVLAAEVVYNRFDVGIAIEATGNFRVTETQDITYPSGASFTRASRNIGLGSVTNITDVTVSQGGQNFTQAQGGTATNTFTLTRTSNNLRIDWYYPQAAGQQRTFVVSYTVVGGLRIYASGDVLDWAAIRPDLSANAKASTVTVQLPQAVAPAQIKAASQGASAKATIVDGRTVRFDAGAVNIGKGLEVKVTFPHGLVSATAPPWQATFDQQQAATARRTAIGNLITVVSFAFGFLILVGGAVGLYLLWYLRGRDRYTGLVADYLREPPSDLSPGVAGTLIDERADLQDVLATFTDLGRKGVLRIDEQNTPGPFGLGGQRDFVVTRLNSELPLTTFEQTLVNTLFLGGGDEVRLSQIKGNITTSLPRFGEELYAEVVERGYFTQSPERTRRHYRHFGFALIGIALVGWIALSVTVGSVVAGLTFTAIPLAIIGVLLILLARVMPAKTPKGAEESAKWNAFKRYLANLEKYDNLDNAKGIFERYLPYATAFGLDRSFIQKFTAVSAPVPQWYGGGGGGPIIIGSPGGGYYGGPGGGYYGGSGSPGGPGSAGGGDPSGGGWSVPSLQDLSDRGGGGVQNWSDSLSDMLNSAGSAFGGGGGDGGGWSGGGGDSGGGGGGGGDFG